MNSDVVIERFTKNKEVLKEVSPSVRWEGTSHKNHDDLVIPEEKNPSSRKKTNLFLLLEIGGYMRKKGETSVQDRTRPQPLRKKEREKKRKDKKLAGLERQQSRQA